MGGGGLAMVGMVLWWLISLAVLFFVVYEAVYLAMRRALSELGGMHASPPTTMQPPQPPAS